MYYQQLGKTIEDRVQRRLDMVYRVLDIRRASDEIDKYMSADYIVNGYSIDITINSSKNFCSLKRFRLGAVRIYYRYSNGKAVFETPVVVIEADFNGNIDQCVDDIVNALVRFKNESEKIIKALDERSVAPDLSKVKEIDEKNNYSHKRGDGFWKF